jgi:hypothetical protein
VTAQVFIPSRGRAEMLAVKVMPKWMQQDAKVFVVTEPDQVGEYAKALFEWDGLNCLGIGIMVPFYGLMFGNQTIKNEDRPLMSKGALGKRLFSLNVPRVLAAGNFDVNLHSGWGDDELVRAGMDKLAATWYVHAGVTGGSVSNRYTQGGINDFHGENAQSRLDGQGHSHRIIYARWGPRYVSDPGKRMSFRWQKFMDDKVPDWRDRIDWEKV